MPKFIFLCESCGREKERLVASSVTEADCGCGGKLKRQLPTSVTSTTYVTKDPHRGTQQKKNLNAQLTKRMREQHDRYELEEKIDKFGIDDALKHGWVKKIKRI